MFPDARFVMTHRDPTDVLLSVADVYADIVGGFTDHVDRRYLGELNVAPMVGRHGPGGEVPRRGADDRFFDIDFRAMLADPVGEVRRLYAWLGEAGERRVRGRDARLVGAQRRESRTAPHGRSARRSGLDLERDPTAVRRTTSTTHSAGSAKER